MSFVVRFSFVVILCMSMCKANDLVVGSNGVLTYSETVKISSIPFTARTKTIFYNTKDTAKIIRGVSVIDLDKSKARATITAGGVGSTYVNIKLKSERGEALNYLVQVYI